MIFIVYSSVWWVINLMNLTFSLNLLPVLLSIEKCQKLKDKLGVPKQFWHT
jgi:hypothetical protein